MNKSSEIGDMFTTSPMPNVSRKLNFDDSPEEPDQNPFLRTPNSQHPTKKYGKVSPPYKKIRALRLFDKCSTPNTILKNSCYTPAPRRSPNNEANLTVNVNPYSPTCSLIPKKRVRNPCSPIVTPQKPKKKANYLSVENHTNENTVKKDIISRYVQEFMELECLGKGNFGTVFKCIHRLDGVIYAVKRSTHPSIGSYPEKRALYEVYAHAVIGSHPNVVRYYSAWSEDDHMYIQNEYCNKGSLADRLEDSHLSYNELCRLIVQVAEGLRYMHSLGLVHLDIKPANIFVHQVAAPEHVQIVDDGFMDIDEPAEEQSETITYKLGDLGHVTSVSNPQVEDGDCRYLSREILNRDHSNLCKADIFAFGMTLLEAAGLKPLPKNGDEWQSIRDGDIPPLPTALPCSLMKLLLSMIDNNPAKRPSAAEILRTSLPSTRKSRGELCKDLQVARREINYLRMEKSSTNIQGRKKIYRSFSTTSF